MTNPVVIDEVTLESGASVVGAIEVGNRPDGTPMVVQYQAKVGRSLGPVLCLEAGLSGDAHEGMFAIPRILELIDSERLHGTLIAVPVVNMPAFELQHRGSPFDPAVIRLGQENGSLSLAEKAARAYESQILSKADYLISFYNWSPSLYWQRQVAYLGAGRSLSLAMSLGAEWNKLWRLPAAPGTSLVAAEARGIPAVALQVADSRGQLPSSREAGVEAIVKGIVNVMRWLEMWPGGWEPAEKWVVLDETPVHNSKWGLLIPADGLKPGDSVEKGTVLFRLWNLYGEEVESITCPVDGEVAALRTFPCVQPGQTVAYISQVAETLDEAL
jgi:predicted deacylase